MNICYLLASVELGGGVRVVFDQARALKQRGHRVSIRALKEGDHRWYPYSLDVGYVDRLDLSFPPGHAPDVVICTYWTTVAPGVRLSAPVTLHLCQGYEGDIPELQSRHSEIEAAYRQAIPKMTVGEWLSERLAAVFGKDQFPIINIGQVVDTSLFTPRRWYFKKWLPKKLRNALPVHITVVGDYWISCKGVADALNAVALLRKIFHHIRLIRVSMFPVLEEERQITTIEESHVRIPPREMASVFMRTDLLLAPSLPPEGFGLPAAEAMACGVPVVLTNIPSYLSFDPKHDYACFAEVHSPEAIADCAVSILNDRLRYTKLQQRGPRVIRSRFDGNRVAENIEKTAKHFLADT